MTIFGGQNAKRHRLLSIMFRPCVPTENGICRVRDVTNHTELMAKLDEAKEYVGNAVIDVYHS